MFCEKDYVLLFKVIYEELLNRDYYFILADLEAFTKAIHDAEKDYLDKDVWAKKALTTSPESATSPATVRFWNMPTAFGTLNRFNPYFCSSSPSLEGLGLYPNI